MRLTGEDTKQRLEEAAIRVFVQKSVAGASVRDIAREARVSLGAMYHHYKSKEDLASGLFVQNWGEMATELRVRAKLGNSLGDKIREMVRYVFESFDKNWELVTYVYLTRHEHLRRVRSDIPNPHVVVRMVIVDAIARGDIPRQDPDLAAAMVMGVIVQVIDVKILGRIKSKLTNCAETVAEACERILTR